MLSRDNSSSSAKIRRSKSSASVGARSKKPGAERLNAETAHHDALTAANLAFQRAREWSEDNAGVPKTTDHSTPSQNAGCNLKKKYSVRFTGPTAAPTGDRSITRRQAASGRSTENQHQRCQTLGQQLTRAHVEAVTALPQMESSSIAQLPYKKLKKARSMFNPRNLMSSLPKAQIGARDTFDSVSGYDSSPSRVESIVPGRSSSALRGQSESLSSMDIPPYDQAIAIRMARDHYLQQLEGERLKQQPSILNLTRPRRSQKSLRKTVRTGSTNSYGPAISSHPLRELEKPEGFGYKARNFSLTLRRKIKQVFTRSSSREVSLPSQQIESQRLHFRDYLPNGEEYPSIPTPDEGLLSRNSSRASTQHRPSTELGLAARHGSIRTVRSASTIGAKSRASSWTNSTINNTMNKLKVLDRKRLTIIQEQDSPHRSSSSARMIGNVARKGMAVFAKPLNSGSPRPRALDTRRVFSALQKRLDASKIDENLGPYTYPDHRLLCHEYSDESLHNSLEGHHRVATIRMLDNKSDDSIPPAELSSLTELAENHDDSISPPSITGKSARNSREAKRQLTYQQMAAQNEAIPIEPKRPLREVKSAFFPSTMQIKRDNISPYRRALRSSIEDEPIIYVAKNLSRDGGPPTPCPSSRKNRTISLSDSASEYSRLTSGSPKPFETVASLARSESSGEPGTVIITESQAISRYPWHSRGTSSTQSSSEWKGWMSAQVASLEKQNDENVKIQGSYRSGESTHRREKAQIHGDDNQISATLGVSILQKQPLACLHGNAGSLSSRLNRGSYQYPMADVSAKESSAEGRVITSQAMSRMPPTTSSDENEKSSSWPTVVTLHRPSNPPLALTIRSKRSYDLQALSNSSDLKATKHLGRQGKVQPQPPKGANRQCNPARPRVSNIKPPWAEESTSQEPTPYPPYHKHEHQAIDNVTMLSDPHDERSARDAEPSESCSEDASLTGSPRLRERVWNGRKDGMAVRDLSAAFI